MEENTKVKAIPRSAKTELVGVMADGTLKIRVKAVPEKGRANIELIEFLAQHNGVPTENIKLLSGATDSRKLFKITHVR